jgi:hypothetical protein
VSSLTVNNNVTYFHILQYFNTQYQRNKRIFYKKGVGKRIPMKAQNGKTENVVGSV